MNRLAAEILLDLQRGLTYAEAGKRHGVSRQYAYSLALDAGIAKILRRLRARGAMPDGEPDIKGWQDKLNAPKFAGTVPQAFAALKDAMRADYAYAWSWRCDIAMAAHDEGLNHAAANRAASRFMRMCFDIDTTKEPGAEQPPMAKSEGWRVVPGYERYDGRNWSNEQAKNGLLLTQARAVQFARSPFVVSKQRELINPKCENEARPEQQDYSRG